MAKLKAVILSNKYKKLLDSYSVNTPLRLAHFFAQIDHESGLKPVRENLNYTVKGLLSTFGRHRLTENEARAYGRAQGQKANQNMIANIVYGGAYGIKNLGNNQPEDGSRFIGRGFIQITGRANYSALSKDTKIDYVKNPDLLLTEADAMISALWFWKKNNINRFADADDIKQVTRRINGGFNGLEHRTQLLTKYKNAFR